MKLKIYQIDAFAEKVFSGNPAAVCPLEEWLPSELMQQIAEENNLADQHPEVISSLKKVMHDYLVNKATKPNTENNLPKYEQLLEATE